MVRRKKIKAENDNSPEFKLKLRSSDMNSRAQSTIGVGWTNSKGGIRIKLDPGVILYWRDMQDCILTLWPVDD